MTTKTWGARALAAAAALGLVLGLGTVERRRRQTRSTSSPNPVVAGEDFTVSGAADCIEGSFFDHRDRRARPQRRRSTADNPWERRLHRSRPTPTAGTYLVSVTGGECDSGDVSLVVIDAAPTTTAPATTTTAVAVADATAAAPAFTG